MEREIWRLVTRAMRGVPRWSPSGGSYTNREVLAVLLWAALHGRAVSWACQRSSWPVQAWRRRLPTQSTLSRRGRDPRLLDDLDSLIDRLQETLPQGEHVVVDGKPLAVSEFSADPDADKGWGAGRHGLGYKLHVLIDSAHRLLAWEVRPMNEAECTVAAELIGHASERGRLRPGALLLGDASYDSNPLHAAAAASGVKLVAPRRRPDCSLCKNREHHPNRVEVSRELESGGPLIRLLRRERQTVERFFGTLATWGAGLRDLPVWARRLHRVRLWVALKLALDAARRRRLAGKRA